MNGELCRDCGKDHKTSIEMLRCTEQCADACRCGYCANCVMARRWREHPMYVLPEANTESSKMEVAA